MERYVRGGAMHFEIIPAALELAARGLPVFPCVTETKAPTTPKGYKDASTDPEIIKRLWRDHPGGLIGVPTGKVIGLDILDLDFGKHQTARDWWRQHRHRIPRTRVHRTRSAGVHLFFQHNDLIRCTAGKISLGVDTRADGGYIIWWPAADLPVLSEAPPTPWPDWLLEQFRPKPRTSSPPGSAIVSRGAGRFVSAEADEAWLAARQAESNTALTPTGPRAHPGRKRRGGR